MLLDRRRHRSSLGGAIARSATPSFLLIVRESLRPGSLDAYNENELKLAAACATLNCPHPYLALKAEREPREVWWLNAFASAEQRDGLADAYARNEPLMAALVPLGKRKEELRQSLTTSFAKYAPARGGDVPFLIAGARFIVVSTGTKHALSGALFETDDGERLVFRLSTRLEAAERAATRFGSDAKVLAVRPQWSFPDAAWVEADPEFWSSAIAANSSRRHP